jgi:hypothetical protein
MRSDDRFEPIPVNCHCANLCPQLANAFRTRTEQERALRVAFGTFTKPSTNARSLRIPAGWSRRQAHVAVRGGGCRIWAESAPTGVASGRTGVRPKAAIPSEREIGFTARSGGCYLLEVRLASKQSAIPAVLRDIPLRRASMLFPVVYHPVHEVQANRYRTAANCKSRSERSRRCRCFRDGHCRACSRFGSRAAIDLTSCNYVIACR